MPIYIVYEWFGDCECCAVETEIGRFETVVLAWLGAALYARDEYEAECDIAECNVIYDLNTEYWSGYVGLEVRSLQDG